MPAGTQGFAEGHAAGNQTDQGNWRPREYDAFADGGPVDDDDNAGQEGLGYKCRLVLNICMIIWSVNVDCGLCRREPLHQTRSCGAGMRMQLSHCKEEGVISSTSMT